jgi:hypothetical protein
VGAPPPQPSAVGAPTVKAWTIMVYMDGDNHLSDWITKDIKNDLCAPGSGSNADVNVVCIAERKPGHHDAYGKWTDAKLFYCTEGMLPYAANAVADWGERDMGATQTLIDFISWAKTNYPANHYLLAFWDSGYSWFPNLNNMEDDTYKDAMNEEKFADALQTAGPVDVVAWDCCLRQLIEVGSVFRPYCQAMVGSEESVNWEGLEYRKFIANLKKYPTWNAEQLADDVAATTRADSACYSEVNFDARWDNLIKAVDQWSVALINALPKYRSEIDTAHAHTQAAALYTGLPHADWDLYDAARNIKKYVPDATVKATSQAVMDAVVCDVGYNWVRPTPMWGMTFGKDNGLAIWWPKAKSELNPKWATNGPGWKHQNDWTFYTKEIPFAAETHWAQFLVKYTAHR